MERLLEPLGPAVQFVYTCLDRIVLNGYIERLQRPECHVSSNSPTNVQRIPHAGGGEQIGQMLIRGLPS
jgi:hypothetical protein